MYRQGKRARFLRNWGEPHSVKRPANVRYLWTEIFAWLDTYCNVARGPEGGLILDGDQVRPS